MAQAEFLQGEIADRFLSETDVDGLRDHEVALLLSSWITTTLMSLFHVCISEF
jgi:hypothetical protein